MPVVSPENIHTSDKYMPCLLMKICDQNPQSQTEHYVRGISIQQLREDILRNIQLILNSRSHPDADELGGNPEFVSSVICMGMKDFCGCSHSKQKRQDLQKKIREQLQLFEPRLIPDSIDVTLTGSGNTVQSEVQMEIRGRIQSSELSEEEIFRSVFELESGKATVVFEIKR